MIAIPLPSENLVEAVLAQQPDENAITGLLMMGIIGFGTVSVIGRYLKL